MKSDNPATEFCKQKREKVPCWVNTTLKGKKGRGDFVGNKGTFWHLPLSRPQQDPRTERVTENHH